MQKNLLNKNPTTFIGIHESGILQAVRIISIVPRASTKGVQGIFAVDNIMQMMDI